MRRRLLGKAPDPQYHNFGETADIVLWDKELGSHIFVYPKDLNKKSFPSSNYTPIGVVVVPASHKKYGDNICGVMSVLLMSTTTPDTGSTTGTSIYWGGYDATIPGQTQYGSVLVYDGQFGNNNRLVKSGYIDSLMKDDTMAYPGDTAVPNPYSSTGGPNKNYGSTIKDTDSNKNAVQDMDGTGNTWRMINTASGQSNWKTSSTITNTYTSKYYPLACCCARFRTVGTKAMIDCDENQISNGQKFWYLPALGELGYINPAFERSLTASLTKICEVYNIDANTEVSFKNFPSSTESWQASYYGLVSSNILTTYMKEGASHITRAFVRLGYGGPFDKTLFPWSNYYTFDGQFQNSVAYSVSILQDIQLNLPDDGDWIELILDGKSWDCGKVIRNDRPGTMYAWINEEPMGLAFYPKTWAITMTNSGNLTDFRMWINLQDPDAREEFIKTTHKVELKVNK